MAKSTVPPSPFAPARLPDMPQVAGVRFATCEAGIRYASRTDLMLAVLDPGTTVAGVLTQVQDQLGAGAVVPPETSPRARPGRWSSTPATPTPSLARRVPTQHA